MAVKAHARLGRSTNVGLRHQTLLVFACAFAALMLLQGNLFVVANDEGLTLESAQRVLAGQLPYVDFFGHASPGSYWLQAAIFKLLGVSIWTARLGVIADVSLLVALLYWFVARYAGRSAAIVATPLFFIFEIADPVFITIQHRWNSCALSFLSIMLALAGAGKPFWWWTSAGVAAAYAALCTPTIGLVPLLTLAWLICEPPLRRHLAPFATGLAVVALPAFAYMSASGMLTGGRYGGYLGHLSFMSYNYAEVNAMPYGAVIGGFGPLFADVSGGELVVRVLLLLCITLPATLPLAGGLGWTVWAWQDKSPVSRPAALYLLTCLGAYVAYSFPRVDLTHLAFFAAFTYALAIVWMVRTLPRRALAGVGLFFGVWAIGFAMTRVMETLRSESLLTPVGTVRVNAQLRPDLEALLASTRPGQTAYVHPYNPLLYFITQTRDPSSFSFLAPGMMKDREEAAVLDDLNARPPQWVLYHKLSREEFLRVFPGGARLNHRYPKIENWIERTYRPARKLTALSGYDLWKLEPPLTTSGTLPPF